VARDLAGLVRTGTLPAHRDPHAPYMAGLGSLMFGVESMRSPTNLATAAMTTELAQRGPAAGGISFEQAFAAHEPSAPGVPPQRPGGGGMYPMSMVGAEAAAEELERERAGMPTVRTPGADELARREIAIAERWLAAELAAEGSRGFADAGAAYEFIKRRLFHFYGVALHRSGRP
jgi:hypothetical protein